MWVWDDWLGDYYWDDSVYTDPNEGAVVLPDGTVRLPAFEVSADPVPGGGWTPVQTEFEPVNWREQLPEYYPIELPPEDTGGGFFGGLWDFLKGIQIQPVISQGQPQQGGGGQQVIRAPAGYQQGGGASFFTTPAGIILIAAGAGLVVYAITRPRR